MRADCDGIVRFVAAPNPVCRVEIGGECADVGNLSALTLIRIDEETAYFSSGGRIETGDLFKLAAIAAGESNPAITYEFLAARPLPEAVAFARFVKERWMEQMLQAKTVGLDLKNE